VTAAQGLAHEHLDRWVVEEPQCVSKERWCNEAAPGSTMGPRTAPIRTRQHERQACRRASARAAGNDRPRVNRWRSLWRSDDGLGQVEREQPREGGESTERRTRRTSSMSPRLATGLDDSPSPASRLLSRGAEDVCSERSAHLGGDGRCDEGAAGNSSAYHRSRDSRTSVNSAPSASRAR
jgi:hypothetical protein